jgi:hypothetical protein
LLSCVAQYLQNNSSSYKADKLCNELREPISYHIKSKYCLFKVYAEA